MEPDIESGNAEKETCLETDSLSEDVGLGTDQSSDSRWKEKRNDISSVDEKQSDSLVESEAISLMKDTRSERDSSVRTPKSPLNEQSALLVDNLDKEHTTGSENGSIGVPVGQAPVQVSEVALGNSTAVAKDDGTPTANVSPSNLAVATDDATPRANVKENNFSLTLHTSFQRNCIRRPKKKLLVLDLNGILVDVVQIPCKLEPHAIVNGKGVFRRLFCDEFLDFCFRTFNVGIWSSRVHKNVMGVLDLLMKKNREVNWFSVIILD